MENNQSNDQVLLRQAVEWLKIHQKSLIGKLATEIANTPELPYQRLPGLLRKLVAKDIFEDLITRLESYSFDAEVVSKKMSNGLKKGATIQSLVTVIDLMVVVIHTQARQELSEQPIFLNVLLNRTEYFANLLKSTIAISAIEHEKSKMSKPKTR